MSAKRVLQQTPERHQHQPHINHTRPCTHKSRLVGSGWSMSGLLPKADIRQRIEHVCFVPSADILVAFLLRITRSPRLPGSGEHLEVIFGDVAGKSVKAISFFSGLESFKASIEDGGRVNLLATFDLSRFGGRVELRLRIVDILPYLG